MNNRNILGELLLVIFLVSIVFFIGYRYGQSKQDSTRQITGRIVNNCYQSLQAADALIGNCNEAYTVATTCVANISSCNVPAATTKLEQLNTQKTTLESSFSGLVKDADSIIQTASHL